MTTASTFSIKTRAVKGTGTKGDMLSIEPLSDWNDKLDAMKVIKMSISTQNFFKKQKAQRSHQSLAPGSGKTRGSNADLKGINTPKRSTPHLRDHKSRQQMDLNMEVREKLSG
mmetsp:Transcript_22536/g.30166  ORF Transcript_22536/g.30166 Transcript_22536/m.30166 type:complete len:113 (-) Transcript_22536:270-608(-)